MGKLIMGFASFAERSQEIYPRNGKSSFVKDDALAIITILLGPERER
jgi:hypothetical protein